MQELYNIRKIASVHESQLNFITLLGDGYDINVATEGVVKDKLNKIGNYIKTFFQKLWDVIRSFFRRIISRENKVMINNDIYAAIKEAIGCFTETLHEECLRLSSQISNNVEDIVDDIIHLSIRKLDKIISEYDAKIKDIRDSLSKKDGSLQSNSTNVVDIDVCKQAVDDSYKAMKKSIENFHNFYRQQIMVTETNAIYNTNLLRSDLLGDLCVTFVSMTTTRISKFYNMLLDKINENRILYK